LESNPGPVKHLEAVGVVVGATVLYNDVPTNRQPRPLPCAGTCLFFLIKVVLILLFPPFCNFHFYWFHFDILKKQI
jgi:hypothetical protein